MHGQDARRALGWKACAVSKPTLTSRRKAIAALLAGSKKPDAERKALTGLPKFGFIGTRRTRVLGCGGTKTGGQ